MRSFMLAIAVCFIGAAKVDAQEMSAEQKEVWDTLQAQSALDAKKDFEGMREYMHPDAVFWGEGTPAPNHMDGYDYYVKKRMGDPDTIAWHLVPVTVQVSGDVAIVNFYGSVLFDAVKGEQQEATIRGHNTWKKEGGRWLLLSTYNTLVNEPGKSSGK